MILFPVIHVTSDQSLLPKAEHLSLFLFMLITRYVKNCTFTTTYLYLVFIEEQIERDGHTWERILLKS